MSPLNFKAAQLAPRPTVESPRTSPPENPRKRPKFWTLERRAALEECLDRGLSDARIAKQLSARFGRSLTAEAINLARKKYGLRARLHRSYTARAVALLLGICPDGKCVQTWIKRGYLRGHRAHTWGPHRRWFISEEALLDFLAEPDHWHRWRPERITEPGLREWAEQLRGGERFLTLGEVARRYCVEPPTVWGWIHRGELSAVRNGNHLISERALDGFTPPNQRLKCGTRQRRFTAAEDARVRDLRAAGWTWQTIADELGRNVGSVKGRAGRLGLIEGADDA